MLPTEIDVDEFVYINEELGFTTPPPQGYTDAYDALVSFRNQILEDLVGARVKALLDAGHDCMDKYKDMVDKLGISTYLFNDIQRKALVWRLKGMDLGEGQIRYAKTMFNAPLADYPLNAPYQVPQRQLPQVDIFSFTARSDVDIKEMEGGASLQGIIALQCGNDDFKETPDAENALYDYYFLYPQVQYHGEYTPSAPLLYGIEDFVGEETLLQRKLHKTSDGTAYVVSLSLWFDAMVHFGIPKDEPNACIAQFGRSEATPVTTIVLGQYRVHSDKAGFWATFPTLTSSSLGWYNFSAGLDSVVGLKSLWFNNFLVTLSVNNEEWGSTNPVEGDYTKKSGVEFVVTAEPEDGHAFDHWELDGVDIGSTNPYSLYPIKPCELKAVFT